MTRPSAKRRRCGSKLAKHRMQIKKKKEWKESLEKMIGINISNPKGRSRTCNENKLIFGTIRLVLSMYLELIDDGFFSINDLTWYLIDTKVADNLQVKLKLVTDIRQKGYIDGDFSLLLNSCTSSNINLSEIVISESQQSLVSSICSNHQSILNEEIIQTIVDEVDRQHSNGKTLTNLLLRNFILQKYEITICKKTMGKYMKRLGLTWQPVKPKKRNVGAYRMDLLRDFIISFDDLYKKKVDPTNNSDYVFVFTDETYIHKTHAGKFSYFRSNEDSTINRSSSKGERLIILHAITDTEPLCEREENGFPISDLRWNGDTPHSENRRDGKFTCELMWKSASSSGDYHDNMNSEMFMKWTKDKLVPCF